jgi:hypothetical protein
MLFLLTANVLNVIMPGVIMLIFNRLNVVILSVDVSKVIVLSVLQLVC